MSFYSPHLLWLLVPLVLLFSWELARHTARAVANWPKIPRAWAGAFEVSLGARHTTADSRPRIWLWFGLALCIVALARPQWGVIEEQVFDQSREVLIAVDLSKSMLAQDVKPSRLDRSKLLIQSLLDGLKGERVGLLLFAGTAFLQSPLSSDYEILREFLPAMNPDYLPEGGSNYEAMLETSLQAFGTSTADRYLIVLSDGESTAEGWKAVAEKLKEKSIRVISLGVGTAQGSFIPDGSGGFVKDERGAVVMSRLNNSTLQELAQLTGGAYTDASTWVDLVALLRSTVEAGQKGQFSEKNTARLVERYQWFLAPGLLLLFLSFWTEFPVRPRERALPLAGANKTRASVASLAVLLTAFFALAAGPKSAAQATPPDLLKQAQDQQTTQDVFTEPLRKKVVELVTKETITAKDFASLAETTVTFGRRLTEAKLPVPEKAVTDALLAVDQGEALDPKAADWPRLREELKQLLPEEKKDEEQPQENQDQKNQDQQNQDKSSQDKSPQNQSQDQQNQDQQQSQQSDDQKQDQQNQQSKDGQPQDEKNQDAFGDMKEPEPKPGEEKPTPPPPSQSGTQKIGGQKDQKPEAGEQDPNLAIPLQKLEQVRNQDSPAKLQQIMQGQQKQPAAKGKDW